MTYDSQHKKFFNSKSPLTSQYEKSCNVLCLLYCNTGSISSLSMVHGVRYIMMMM